MVSPSRLSENKLQQHADDEAPEMRPPRHATEGLIRHQRRRALEKLEQNPESKEKESRYFDELHKEKDRDQRQNP